MTQQQTRTMAAPHAAPRCQHITLDEQPCGAPALRGRRFCRFHQHIDAPRDYSIPAFEDAAGVQLALMQVVRALQDKAIDNKTASLTLYALQIAATNLKRFQAERDAAFPAPDQPHPGEQLLAELKRVLEEEKSQSAASSDATPATLPEIKASAATFGNRHSEIGNLPARQNSRSPDRRVAAPLRNHQVTTSPSHQATTAGTIGLRGGRGCRSSP